MDDIQVNPEMDKLKGNPTTFESVKDCYMEVSEINNSLPDL
jgi:hypothetical protein